MFFCKCLHLAERVYGKLIPVRKDRISEMFQNSEIYKYTLLCVCQFVCIQ